MLIALFLTALVWSFGAWLTFKAAVKTMRRFGLDPLSVLLWLGLAEFPVEQKRSERPRLRELLDAPMTASR